MAQDDIPGVPTDQLDPQTLQAISWIKSPVFVSLGIAFVTHLAAAFGRVYSIDLITALVQNLLDCVVVVVLGWAMYKRWRSKIQPLALTKKAASVINSTPPGDKPP